MIVASRMADNVPPMRGMLLVRGNNTNPREFSSTKLNPATMAIKIASFLLIQMFVSDGIFSAVARSVIFTKPNRWRLS